MPYIERHADNGFIEYKRTPEETKLIDLEAENLKLREDYDKLQLEVYAIKSLLSSNEVI